MLLSTNVSPIVWQLPVEEVDHQSDGDETAICA
jgi:hypothetical protein